MYRSHWRDLIPVSADPTTRVLEIDMLARHLVVWQTAHGVPRVLVYGLPAPNPPSLTTTSANIFTGWDAQAVVVPLPEHVCAVHGGSNEVHSLLRSIPFIFPYNGHGAALITNSFPLNAVAHNRAPVGVFIAAYTIALF
jgi:hypothetical protein